MANDYYSRVARVESGNNPNARNPRSSASGTYQFIDSTYLNHARRVFPGMSDQELLANKNNPQFQEPVMRSFTTENEGILKKAGFEPTDGTRYLAHFAGPGGAVKALSADPKASVADVLGQNVVESNPFLNGKNIGDLVAWANSKAGGQSVVDGGGGEDPTAVQGGFPPQQTTTPYTDSLIEGGPLALFGKGQRGYDWGNALMGVGAGLASINSPQQAAAITAQMQAGNPGNSIQSQYDQNTGTWYHYDKRTGQTSSYQDPKWLENRTNAANALAKARSAAAGAKPKDVEVFRGTQDNMDMTANILTDLVDIRQAAAANPNAFGIYGKLRAQVGAALDGMGESKIAQLAKDTFGNVSDDDIAALGKLQRARNQLIALAQLPQKGQQTESDARRFDLANFDQLSNLSGKALVSTLDNLIEDHGKAYNRLHSYYRGDLNKFGADPRFDNSMVDYFGTQKQTLDERLKKYRDTPVQVAPQAAPAAPGAPAGETPEQRLERLKKKMNQ